MTTKAKCLHAKCIHYFLIGESQGPTSQGKCAKCGEVKEFWNVVDTHWKTNLDLSKSDADLEHTLSYYR